MSATDEAAWIIVIINESRVFMVGDDKLELMRRK